MGKRRCGHCGLTAAPSPAQAVPVRLQTSLCGRKFHAPAYPICRAAKIPHAEREQVHPETRRQWRAWLKAHHASHAGVWLVTWKKHTGKPAMGYEAAVEEALCFGWVDSTQRRLDDDRNAQWFAPRRRGSVWSGINKQRVARLTAAGSMAPAGLAAVEAAQQSGAWSAMDAAEALVVPEELEAAFSRHPGSRPHWDAFPPSARRSILGWVAQAKRPDTRARRVEHTAALAARGERAK